MPASVNVRSEDGERACAYVLERVKRAAGARWAQGKYAPAFEVRGGGEAARVVAERRLWRVERAAARGLVAWANGDRDVVLLTRVPAPREVLALQARGRRCVSLLPDGAGVRPDYGVPADAADDGLAFALHDVCHLEKFVDPEHHGGQVGFFRAFDDAMGTRAWAELDARLDDAWRREVDHVAADMNGSVVFLFAALKMKLKMAVRREVARASAEEAPREGPLDAREERAYGAALETLLDVFEMRGEDRDAARAVSTRRDAREAALRVERSFFARSRFG